MNFKSMLKLFGGCVVVSLLASCATDKAPSSSKTKLAFVTNTAADFWTLARKGCEQADQELNDVEVEFRIADGTAADQRRIVDDLTTKGVGGIAISPVDPANQTQLLNDLAQKAVVITQDSDAPQSNRICYIGTDNVAAGKQAGELLKEALPNGGKIMIFVGKIDAQNAKERYEGIKQALEGSKITIIDVKTDDTDQVRAKANAADTIVKYPDIAALVGLWGYNGPAILNAVKEAGKVGKVRIVCFDDEVQTLAGVADGSIDGTIVQQPYEFGYQAIKLMSAILKGDKSGVPETRQKFIPTLVVKKGNVQEYSARLAKLKG
jgi:ribose transport system substrate-binding protein